MRSRDIILEATRAQIGESGFDGVSIAGVATRAWVSRQTVSSIFSTREDLDDPLLRVPAPSPEPHEP